MKGFSGECPVLGHLGKPWWPRRAAALFIGGAERTDEQADADVWQSRTRCRSRKVF